MDCDYYNNIYLIENFATKSYPIGHKCKKDSECASSFCSLKGKCKLSNAIAQKAKAEAEKKKKKQNPIITTIPIIDKKYNEDNEDNVIVNEDNVNEDNVNEDDVNEDDVNEDDVDNIEDDNDEEPRRKKKKKNKKKKKKKNKNKNLSWIISIVVILIIGGLFVGGYFYMKNRNNISQQRGATQMEIEYER